MPDTPASICCFCYKSRMHEFERKKLRPRRHGIALVRRPVRVRLAIAPALARGLVWVKRRPLTAFAASVTIVDLPAGTTVTGGELLEAALDLDQCPGVR
jgi:hypothetical protein